MGSRAQRVLLAAGAVLFAAVVVGIVLLTRTGSGHGSAVGTSSLTVGVENAPPPPRGALVLARESGTRAVALAVGKGPRLTATVLAQSGDPLSGLPLSFRLGGDTVRAGSCGPGCYSATAPSMSRVREVDVLLGTRAVRFDIPASSPPAARIVARAARIIRRLRSLVYIESLRSGPTGGLVTTWRMRAPDLVTYDIRGGASAVVIGRTRWDRDNPTAPWRRSAQLPPLSVPQPSWGKVATNARILGTGTVEGRPVWIVSFANPTTPAWFTAWIDRQTHRTLRLRMTAAAHFMFHRYLEFNEPLAIRPPR